MSFQQPAFAAQFVPLDPAGVADRLGILVADRPGMFIDSPQNRPSSSLGDSAARSSCVLCVALVGTVNSLAEPASAQRGVRPS